MHKNFRNVGQLVYGRGAFDQLGSILDPQRTAGEGYFVFLVDDWFEGRELPGKLPAVSGDVVRFIDASHEEPKTGQVDELRQPVGGAVLRHDVRVGANVIRFRLRAI